VLFVITGSSCSGKSTLAQMITAKQVEVHDSDEAGVPSNADLAWRQRELERWVQLALVREREGVDLVLTGQSPLGEVLATPSAPRLNGVAVCLVDVADRERWLRLDQRDAGRWDDGAKRRFIGWARWHRQHANDPGYVTEALTHHCWPDMQWQRWRSWTAGDPRWRTDVIDTTKRPVDDCAIELTAWIAAVRAATNWPLAQGWVHH
jgi:hypothetical protein